MVEFLLLVATSVLIAFAFLALIAVYAARYKKVPPNHAMVLFGRKYQSGRGYEVWTGGGKFILPIIEGYALISLEPFPIERPVEDVVTDVKGSTPVVVHVSVSATAKVCDDPEVLRRAASHVLHKNREELRDTVIGVLEGHTRGILATTRDPAMDVVSHADRIRSAANSDLATLGLEVRTLALRIRPAGMSKGGAPELTRISRELESIEMRLDQIEARLGLRA